MPDTLRSCMVAEEGYTFISLDASQIELRVAAILSQDPQMLDDLATGDLHLASAIRISRLKGEVPEDWLDNEIVRKKKRYDAKQCNFAVIYGAQEFQLSTMLECSTDEALEFMGWHRAIYPRLYEYIDEQIALAKEQEYVHNMFGRIRPVPEINSGLWKVREKAEKEAFNTIIQGTAVDIVKLCMIQLRHEILDLRTRVVLQVHDEILLEVPDDIVASELIRIREELPVRFKDYPFSVKMGKCYGELKDA